MDLFVRNFLLALPLFLIIGLGWGFASFRLVSQEAGKGLTKFAFTVAIPLLLFRQMSRISEVRTDDLAAPVLFFGAGLALFLILRPLAGVLLKLDCDGRTIISMAGIYSNTVLMGIPLCELLLPAEAMPSLSVIFALNAFLWWTLVTVMIGFSRAESPSPVKTLIDGTLNCLKSPVTIGMLGGILWSLAGLVLPQPVEKAAAMLAGSSTPVALFAVGVSLAHYKITAGLAQSAFVCLAKLAAYPLLTLAAAAAFGLDPVLAKGIFILAALPVGVNVFVMSQVFHTGERAVTNSLVITTALSAATVPLLVTACELLL